MFKLVLVQQSLAPADVLVAELGGGIRHNDPKYTVFLQLRYLGDALHHALVLVFVVFGYIL